MKSFNPRIPLIVGLLLALPAIASAHAFLDHAEPKVGSVVETAPTEVRIWFTQQPEVTFSKIKVLDARGNPVDKGDTHADSADKKLLIVSVSQLPPGVYKVVWKVLSVDTHRTSGDFKFAVK